MHNMTPNEAFNMGAQIGWSWSGEAARDIKLQREQTRTQIEAQQAKTALAYQQMQYAQEDREKQQALEAYSATKNALMETINDKNKIPAAIKAMNNFLEQYGEQYNMGNWSVNTAFANTNIDQNKLLDHAVMAYSIWGNRNVINPIDDPDGLNNILTSMLEIKNNQTGESYLVHPGDILATIGGDTGYQIIQMKDAEQRGAALLAKEKAKLEMQEQQSKIAKTLNDINVDNTNTQIKQQEANTKAFNAQVDAINKQYDQNRKDNNNAIAKQFITQNWDNLQSVTGGENLSGKLPTNADGNTPISQEATQQNINAAMHEINKMTTFTDDGKALAYAMTQDQINNILSNAIMSMTDKNGKLTAASAVYIDNFVDAQVKLMESGIPEAMERANYIRNALAPYDDKFGSGVTNDNRITETLKHAGNMLYLGGGYQEAIDNPSIDPYSILKTAVRNTESALNTQIVNGANEFLDQFKLALANKAMLTSAIGDIFNGRMSKFLFEQQYGASDWRNMGQNFENANVAVQQILSDLDVAAKHASPSKRADCIIAARNLRKLWGGISNHIRFTNDIIDDNINNIAILKANNKQSVENAIIAAQNSNVIYLTGDNKAYLIPKGFRGTLDNVISLTKDQFRAKFDIPSGIVNSVANTGNKIINIFKNDNKRRTDNTKHNIFESLWGN